MKKHIKIIASLGLSMPLALTASFQAKSANTSPSSVDVKKSFVETKETSNNMVLNRITGFTIDKQSQYGLGHVDVHNDNQPHTDHHTDRESTNGNHTDSHSDNYGSHTDNHLDTGDD